MQVHTGNYIRKTARATCTRKTNQAGKAMPRDTEGLNGTAKVTTKCAYDSARLRMRVRLSTNQKKKKKATQVKIALFPHIPRNSTRKYCLQDVKMAETHCSTFTTYRPFPDPRHPAFRSSSTVVPPCPSVALSAVNCLLLRAL